MKMFTLFLALAASAGTIIASEMQEVDGIWYDFDDNTQTAQVISSQSSRYAGTIIIPISVSYNNYTYRVTSIGGFAFYYCSGLTSIEIPNSVTSIGDGAFEYCEALTSIEIPNSVTSIGGEAFNGCTGLTSPVYNSHVFAYLPTSYSGVYTIPEGIATISGYAFYYCKGLTSVTIPNSVMSIGNYAFGGCSGLTSITIGNSVTSIRDYAFSSCTALTSVTIPNSVTNIGYGAFSYCSGLTSVTIGNSITSIRDYAFSDCAALTSVTIPNSVTNIGKGAFDNCSSLPVENHLRYADTYLVEAVDKSLSSYTIKAGTKWIGSEAFSGCVALTSITIGNNVTNIGELAFYDCTGLTSIEIPNSVTNIGEAAFYGCTGLTSPVYNAHVFAYLPTTYSGVYTIPEDIATVSGSAFNSCSGLTSVTIPNSVSSIGNGAFYACTGLTSVTCYAVTPPELGEYVFDFQSGVDYSQIPLYVPIESINLYKSAEKWEEFTNILPIAAKDAETNTVKAEPTANSVEVTWPVVAGAYTYELVIKDKSGNVVCTLVFNAQGQLISIAFAAPTRDGAPQQTQGAGFSFVVNGLDSGTEYIYDVITKDENGNVLDTKSGSFTTQVLHGIDDIYTATKSHKLLRDGQILILRGDRTYTLTGQEVR